METSLKLKNKIIPKHFTEFSAKRRDVSEKIFDDVRDKQLPVPINKPGEPSKEFNDVLYRCFVPEEKQKRNKRNAELKIDIDKNFGWDKLFSDLYKVLYTVECVKLRHKTLIAIVYDLVVGNIWLTDSSPLYKVFENLKLSTSIVSKDEFVKLVKHLAVTHYNYTVFRNAVTKTAFEEGTSTQSKDFITYIDRMKKFMASDSAFVLKRVSNGIEIIWTGDGGVDQPADITLSSPAPFKFISKNDFREYLETSTTYIHGEHNKAIVLETYNELYDSLFGYLSNLVPGLSSNLHSKVRAEYELDVLFQPKVAPAFLDYLVQDFDIISLSPEFKIQRGKYIKLLVQRSFNKEYIEVARALNSQKTALELNDKVRCSIFDPEINEYKEVVARMRPWSRNKKKLSIDYLGEEYKISEVKDLRLYVNEKINEKSSQDKMIHAALNSTLQFSIKQFMPEFFARAVTQTPTGKIGFSTLRTWIMIWQKLKFAGSKDFKRVPKYVLPYSQLVKNEMFKSPEDETGDSSRTDSTGLTVDNKGRLLYIPKISEDFPLRYESILDELLEKSYSIEEPFNIDRTTSQPIYKINKTTEEIEQRAEAIEKLRKFRLLPLAANWNTNVVLYPNKSNLNSMNSISLDGAMTPDVRTLADWLGMPTVAGGRYPNGKSALKAYGEILGVNKPRNFDEFCNYLIPVEVFYYWLMLNGKVPTYEQLLEKSRSVIASLDRPDIISELDTEESYRKIFSGSNFNRNDLGYIREPKPNGVEMLRHVFELTDKYSPKINSVSKSHDLPVTDHPCYLDFDKATFTGSNSIQQVSSVMLGGVFWMELCKSISKFINNQRELEDLAFDSVSIDPEDFMAYINFEDFSRFIVPQVKMWSSYINNADDILLEAHEYKKSLQRTDGYVPVIPGVKEIDPNNPDKGGFALQPHQADVMQYSASHPKYMILDVAPGGGKTILGLSEILVYLSEGRIKRPLVIAPINLIKNWINDCVNNLQAPVNFIVLTSETVNEWGKDHLAEKIKNAPPNTIVCTSYNWLYNPSDTNIVMYGIKPVKLFGNIEFLKQFAFDYIAADEAHRLKNAGLSSGKTVRKPTSTHLSVLRLVSSKHVKYVRLLTGTLIKNTLLDLVGQVRLLNPAIFRTIDEFKAEYGDPNVALNSEAGRSVQQEMRNYLQEFVTVVQKKKRHWAFVMPEFEDQFDFVDPDDAAIGYYEWVLGKTLEEIESTLGSDSKSWKLLTEGVKIEKENDGENDGEGEDVDLDDEDDSEESLDSDSDTESEDSDPGESASVRKIEALLKPHLSRLEQALTDPEGDPEFEEFEEAMAREGRKLKLSPSRKLLKIYELLDVHFEGKASYVDGSGEKHEAVEAMGKLDSMDNKDKVLIFGKYHRSVDSIFKHMPEKYKKHARVYNAGVKEALEDFLTRPDLKILVALEDSIQEGHNIQIASRLIRSEQVWTPGEMDQAVSRIHRPDIGNKYGRTKIIHNWIIVNNTLEVAKLGRLISKFVSKAKFDEADVRYQMLPDLPPIRMSLNVINGKHPDSKRNFSDIIPYLEAYGMDPEQKGNIRGLAQYQQEDFEYQRVMAAKENRDKMVPVKAAPMMEGSKFIKQLPYVMGQSVYDPEDLGLIPLKEYMEINPELKEDPKTSLRGLPVHTSYGEGIIQSVREIRKGLKKKHKGSSVDVSEETNDKKSVVVGFTLKIRLGNGGEIDGYHWTKTFVITKTSVSMKKLLKKAKGDKSEDAKPVESPKSTLIKDKLNKLLKKKRIKDIIDEQEDTPVTTKKKKTIIEETPTKKKTTTIEKLPSGKKRTIIVEEDQPVVKPKIKKSEVPLLKKLKPKAPIDKTVKENNAPLTQPKLAGKKVKESLTPTKDFLENKKIEVWAVDSNGIPTLMLSHEDPDSQVLAKKLKFNYFGSYIFTEIKTPQIFESVVKDLKAQGFELSNSTKKVFDAMSETFRGQKNKMRAMMQLKLIDKRLLFDVTRKRGKLRNPNLLKIYPIVENGDILCLYVDTSQNDPAAIRLRNMKKLPNVPQVKWKSVSGIWVYQGVNKGSLLKKLDEFAKVGLTVENLAKVKQDINKLF
jgi:hypothetical protein